MAVKGQLRKELRMAKKLRTCVAAATRELRKSYAILKEENDIEQEKLRSYAKQTNSF